MDAKQRSRRDFRQNIAITLLSFSAVLLLAQTQLYNRALELPSFRDTAAVSTPSSLEDSSFTAPVRVAVSGSYGRYGSITLTTATASEEFSPLGSLLGEVLGSAQVYTACTQADLLSALSGPSVYYDFLTSLPLSILGGLVGVEGDDSIFARHLVVTGQEGDRVQLYLWDHGGRTLTCTTALSSSILDELIGRFELGNAMFAFDAQEDYAPYAQALCPLSLFLPETDPALPLLTASSPLTASDAILSALEFNPHTQTRWTEDGGTEVIVDGDRTLRIREDGSLSYRSGGSQALTIGHGGEESPPLWDAVTKTHSLLNRLLPAESEAKLYLKSVSRSGNATSLTFDYQYNGVPIRFSSGTAAAKVTLSGNVVASLAFLPRQYHTAEETSLLLPFHQALAIASQTPGAELLIGYADPGEETVSPQWLCE